MNSTQMFERLRFCRWWHCAAGLALWAALGANVLSRAQTAWTVTTGDWATGSNWNAGVPDENIEAVIANGGTATLAGDGSALMLTLGQAAAGSLTINSGNLTVGAHTFIGTNTGNGAATVAGGTLAITGDLLVGYFRPGTLTASGGTVSVGGASYVGYSSNSTALVTNGSWTTTGDLYVGVDAGVGGTGTLTISGGTTTASNVYVATDLGASGTINLNGGVLATAGLAESNGSGGGHINFNGGTLRATASNANFISGFEPGDIQLASGGGTIDSNGLNIEIANVLQGAGALTKTGSGTLILSGANSYTGATNVNGGTLQLASSSNIASSSVITVNSGGTLTAPNFQIGSAASGTEAFAVSGGTVSIAGETYIGHTHAGNATLSGGSWTNGGGIYVGVGGGTGNLVITGGNLSAAASTIAGAGLDTGTGTATISGGTWTSTGSLSVGYSGVGQLTVNGGTVTASDVRLSNDASGAGTINLNGGVLATGSLIRGNGSGQFNFNGGTLRATASNADFTSGFSSGDLQIQSGGATIDTQAHVITISTALQGTGALVKSGAGTLTLSGVSDFSGSTTVAAGTLNVAGSLASSAVSIAGGAVLKGSGTVGELTVLTGAKIAPGNSPGTLAAGNTSLAGGGGLVWEINSVNGSAGNQTGWDLLSIHGGLTLTATSGDPFIIDMVSLTTGNTAGSITDFNPTSSYSFVFATATGGISGFSSDRFEIRTNQFENAFSGPWSVSSDGYNLSLNYNVQIPEPAAAALLCGGLLLFLVVRRRRV